MILTSENLLNSMFLFVTAILIASVLIGISALLIYVFALWQRSKERHKKSLDTTLLEIALPRDNEIKIDAAEQLFSSFASLKTPSGVLAFTKISDSLTFEIVSKPQDIRFYVGVPKKLQDMVEKQINGAYPDAQIKEVEDYNIFENEGKVAFSGLTLKKESFKPIKTYKEFAIDPLSTL